jgi:hypothetical protein
MHLGFEGTVAARSLEASYLDGGPMAHPGEVAVDSRPTGTKSVRERDDVMKKTLKSLSLHRETLHCLNLAALGGVAAAETGSNPHSACLTCSCFCDPNPTA